MKIFIASIFVMFVCSIVVAQQPQDKTDQVLKQLLEISKTLDTIKKDSDVRIGKAEADVKQLKKSIDNLQTPTVPLKKTEDATVSITNSWTHTVSITINGQLHRVVPGSTKPVTVLSGKFTYQCLDLPNHITQERTLISGGTFHINIVPSQTIVQQPIYSTPIYYYYPSGPIYWPCR